jgi:streptomycin 6-kinase
VKRGSTIPLDPAFRQRIIDVHGDAGRDWLVRLPLLVAHLTAHWQLELGEPFKLSYSFVAAARRRDGTNVVLKIGVPGPDLDRERRALVDFESCGMVRLIDSDGGDGALLLERLSPGTSLSTVENEEAELTAAADVLELLSRPMVVDDPAQYPTTQDWALELSAMKQEFGGGTGPFPADLVERAERLFLELHADREPVSLLHGDLHQDNILAAERRPWLGIDPKGVLGERAYEAGSLLRNPWRRVLSSRDPRALVLKRASFLADRLGLDRRRLVAYGVAQLVLAAWWAFEDHDEAWEPLLAVAESVAPLARRM